MMQAFRAACSFLILLLVAIEASADLSVEEICDRLKQSPFFPLRCIDEEGLSNRGDTGRKFAEKNTITELQPVVLIPGFAASGLEARLDKDTKPAWYCLKNWDWFNIWFPPNEVLVQECWTTNLQTHFHPNNNTYTNTPGVEIQPRDFGGLHGIDYLMHLAGIPISLTTIYGELIKSFEAVGYVGGKNLRGAPFDWRMPPSGLVDNGWYVQLKQLIEETSASNNNVPVHVITHSMGGPTFAYFLNQQTQQWRDQYIATFIPIAGPWGGTPRTLRGLVSGDDFGLKILGVPLLNRLKFRNVARGSGGAVYLIPNPDYWAEEPFVMTNTRNYSAKQFAELFHDMQAPEAVSIYSRVSGVIDQLLPPNVTTHCVYGVDTPTEIFYHYPTGNFDEEPIIGYSLSGDGVVPLQSLRECTTWENEQTQPLNVKEFDLREHTDILTDPEMIEYLLTVTTSRS